MSFFEDFYNRFKLFTLSPPRSLYNTYSYNLWLNKLKTSPENIFSSSLTFLIISSIFSLVFLYIDYNLGISVLISSVFVFFYLLYYPIFYTNIVKIESNYESIWITIFFVLYLKRNPNIEKAVEYVAYYTQGNLADDLKELLIDLENKKYSTLDQAITEYSKRWYYLNPDFVYVIVNLLSVQYMTSPDQINRTLDRILNWIINRSKSKSEEYVLELKQPANIILTFLITLPLVSLIMLPIISIFLTGTVSFTFIAFSYIIILPIITFLVVQSLLSKRPFAFSIPDLSLAKDLPRYGHFKIGNKEIPVKLISYLLSLISIIGFYHIGLVLYQMSTITTQSQYIQITYQERSLGNMFLVLTIPFGLGLSLGSYFYLNSFQRVKRAKEIEEMEEEFPLVTYEIANMLDEGYPLEIALGKTYNNYKIIKTSGIMEKFLVYTLINLRKGYDVISSIFDRNIGSINYYPSKIIREALYIIASSVSKGPSILSQITYNISTHLENINSVRELIRKTLSEISSMLEATASSIIPFMSGIVTVFNFGIVMMLLSLVYFFNIIDQAFGIVGSNSIANFIINTFNLYNLIPATFFEVIIGIYFIESVLITSYFAAGIKYGFDKTMIYYTIGKNLINGTIMYSIFVIAGLIIVNIIFGPLLPTPTQLLS